MNWRSLSYGCIGVGVMAILLTGGKEAAKKLEADSRERTIYTEGLSKLKVKSQDLRSEGSEAFKLVTKNRSCRPVRAMSLNKQVGGNRGWIPAPLAVGQIATIDSKREEAFPEGEFLCTEDGQIAAVGSEGRVVNPLGSASADPAQIPRVPPKDMPQFKQFFAYIKSSPGPVAVASSLDELQFLRKEEQAAGINIDSAPGTAQAATVPVEPPIPAPPAQPPVPAPPLPQPQVAPAISPTAAPPFSGGETQDGLPPVKVQ